MTHKWRMEKQENSHPPLFFVNMHRKAEKISQYICLFKNKQYLCTRKPQGYLGRVARQRSAKPSTAVRIRQVPQRRESFFETILFFFCLYLSGFCRQRPPYSLSRTIRHKFICIVFAKSKFCSNFVPCVNIG